MRTRATFVVCAALLVVLALSVFFLAGRTRREAETRLREAESRTARLREDLKRVEASLNIAADENPAKVTAAVASPPQPAKPASTPPRIRPPGLMDLSRNNPQLLNYFIAWKKGDAGKDYGPLFLRLGLSSEQVEKFKTIRAESLARSVDIAAAADAQELPRTDSAVEKLRAESEKRTQAELAALLGETGYAALKDYERTLGVRGWADGLAALVVSTEPLTAEQADQLTHALAKTSAAYRAGGAALPKEIDWDEVDRHAQAFLTPGQFAAWKHGNPHNISGGSRTSVALDRAYERATKPNTEIAPKG